MRRFTWLFFVFLTVSVGCYPLAYLLTDLTEVGLLATKPDALLNSYLWTSAFYLHIGLGGVSLLTGWSQFSRKWRAQKPQLHRLLGKVYVTAVIISGISALYIAWFATGGAVAQVGFSMLGILWLLTTSQAFYHIRGKRISEHRKWMIRSYALTFAAVTLRLWMPILIGMAGMEFFLAYRIIAWLCWVPNLLVAEWIILKTSVSNTNRRQTLKAG